jgi:hypothetical protein
MTARRHHFIAQCYLRGFTANRKKQTRQLVVFDKTTRKSFRCATHNVALEKDFNRIDLEGVEPDAFENAMAQFEGLLGPALQRVGQGGSIKNETDRAILLNFIGLLTLRTPRMRERIRDFHERIAKTVLEIATATPERWDNEIAKARNAGYVSGSSNPSHEQMRKFVEGDQYKIHVPTNRHIALEVATFDKILPFLFERKWLLLKAAKNSGGFVTSDHPVCLMWSDRKEGGKFHGPGLGLTGTELILPISHKLALVGAFELQDDEIEASERMVAAVNGAVVAYSERQVFARDMNFYYLMTEVGTPRKASRLTGDPMFIKSNPDSD